MSDDSTIHRTEPVYTQRQNGRAVAVHANTAASERVRFATEYQDGDETKDAALNIWLRDNLLDERRKMSKAFADVYAEAFVDIEDQIAALERRVERLTGALDVLTVGRMMRVRGTFNPDTEYKMLDVVMFNGSSFVALEDRPGPCPGEHWQLLASCGSRGARGTAGARGERGAPGLSASPATSIKGLHIDPANYMLTILTTDKVFHQLSLRPLFQHFLNQVRGGG